MIWTKQNITCAMISMSCQVPPHLMHAFNPALSSTCTENRVLETRNKNSANIIMKTDAPCSENTFFLLKKCRNCSSFVLYLLNESAEMFLSFYLSGLLDAVFSYSFLWNISCLLICILFHTQLANKNGLATSNIASMIFVAFCEDLGHNFSRASS